jgi:DNA-binding MarR family transcriptional regulator
MVQMNVLTRIYYHGDCEITALVDTLQVSKAAAGQLVERMGQQGLVERRPDPQDRRARRVSLTGKGKALVEASIAARQAWMADLLAEIPAQELPAVANALRTLTAAAENLEALSPEP